MIIFDEVTWENTQEHNPQYLHITDHPYRILKVGVSGSGKTNALLNLINHQPDNDKIFLHVKDSYKRFFFLLGNTPYKAEQPLRGMELQEKEAWKRLKHTGNLFRKNLQLKDVC